MLLTFLGKGGAFDDDINSSAYFMHNNQLILIDCGENTFRSIKKIIDENNFDDVSVLITHTHADHVNGLSTLAHYLYFIKKIKLFIIATPQIQPDIKNLMKINGNTYEQFSMSSVLFIPDINIRFVRTKHCDELISYGILVQTKKGFIYYSGDSCTIPPCIKYKLKNNIINEYYQDLSLLDYEGNVHMSKEVFNEECPKEYCGEIIFYHYKNN